ncbi:MAG: hypothetical protein ILA29_02955 [Prevotella sp.]|nr:hypothetical protein [Prevotella sp.]
MAGNDISHVSTGGGDFAGRDITKVQYNFSSGNLKELYQRFEQERKENKQFNQILEDLEAFQRQKSNETVIGLEAKLQAANKTEELIEMATELKEKYAKKLERNQFFESAQRINIYLLGFARTQFVTNVYPAIKDKSSDSKVNALMDQYVIQPMLKMLEGDTYGFTPQDIHGILYYLTGNCYIKWV